MYIIIGLKASRLLILNTIYADGNKAILKFLSL